MSSANTAMMCAMRAAAGGQQQLRLRQLQRSGAGSQQQHPAHQQIGNEPLHRSSLHSRAAITLKGVMRRGEAGLPAAMRELLDRGGLILTANASAARALDRRYAKDRHAELATAWPTPHILDVQSWLTEQWQTLLLTGTEDRLLLNDLQEHTLWQRIMGPQLKERSLIEPASMATLAQQAYALLALYGALGSLSDMTWLAESGETELFRLWARNFQQECKRRHWMPRCELIGAVAHALRWGALASPPSIGWLGFDRVTPADRDLQAALEARGVAQQILDWQIPSVAPPQLYAAPSETDETATCAAWVHERLAARSDTRIGILMPDLASRRAQLERELYRLLSPQNFPISAGAAPTLPFEFSLGQPLARTPLVHAALLLLRWLHEPLAQQEISWLLLSSTLAAIQNDDAREAMAQWDARMRNAPCAPPEMTIEALLRQPQNGAPDVTALVDDLSAMLQAYRRASRPASAGEWVQRIGNLLRLARWGESSSTSSLLFQVREAWEELLDMLASLDFAGRTMRYEDVLTTLEASAHETIFAPESEDAPVQVMGAFAASGQSFDAVWFLGVTDTAWPAEGRPSSLLPLTLQRELGMPHTSASDDDALAHRVIERIIEGSREVVFSYAQQVAESLQRPSSLIINFVAAELTHAPDERGAIQLEQVEDDTWVPLAHTGVAPGGQTALKRQADCPFQAFVYQRLRVRELPVAGRGLSPMERGKLLHEVLQGIWSKDAGGHRHLTTHDELLAANASDILEALVAAHTTVAIRNLGAEIHEAWQRAYLDAERRRTIGLVMDWLEYESKRLPFAVKAVEEKIAVQVGELALNVRADRIDTVAGGELLIDYKTGDVSPSSWEGARPDQPQLPLYAAFGKTEQLVGALFAQIRRPKLVFKGQVADARTNLSERVEQKYIKPFTTETVKEWRGVLIHLAESFVRGEAQVDPHVYPKTCQFCPLQGLCRIAELRGSGISEYSADDEDEVAE